MGRWSCLVQVSSMPRWSHASKSLEVGLALSDTLYPDRSTVHGYASVQEAKLPRACRNDIALPCSASAVLTFASGTSDIPSCSKPCWSSSIIGSVWTCRRDVPARLASPRDIRRLSIHSLRVEKDRRAVDAAVRAPHQKTLLLLFSAVVRSIRLIFARWFRHDPVLDKHVESGPG